MDCKRTVKLIKPFLNDDLDTDDLRDFMTHIECCDECREELTIEFLVREGVKRLETGNVFDLHKELNGCMNTANKNLKMREGIQWFYYVMVGLIVVAIAAVVMLLIYL